MRYRVTYDLYTSSWSGFGMRDEVQAASAEHAKALVERAVYARKDAILDARHDDAGTGFRVEITGVREVPA